MDGQTERETNTQTDKAGRHTDRQPGQTDKHMLVNVISR